MSELLSYAQILSDIKKFKQAGTANGDSFNIYDTPGNKYFKILFYFGSESNDESIGSSGFLAPTWEIIGAQQSDFATFMSDYLKSVKSGANAKHMPYYKHNSAWAYLMMNDEVERAEKLEKFVTLLSDINSNSPWYFRSVAGINEALERKFTASTKVDFGDEDRRITINCLPDAFDNRITTLLELYRDITWSWPQKKQMVPANLRRFDMAIYIFEAPELNWHTPPKKAMSAITDSINGLAGVNLIKAKTGEDVVIDTSDENAFKPSFKMIEFHDCEFEYNSIKSGWNELNNDSGFNPTYAIEIKYRDCYEISYNDIMMRTIGDVIKTDTLNAVLNVDEYKSKAQTDSAVQAKMIKDKTYPYDKSILGKAFDQLKGHIASDISSWINRIGLGNLYSFGISDIKDLADGFMDGDIIGTASRLGSEIKNAKSKRNAKKSKKGGDYLLPGYEQQPNSFESSDELDNKNIYVDDIAGQEGLLSDIAIASMKAQYLGNIFNEPQAPLAHTSIANNL